MAVKVQRDADDQHGCQMFVEADSLSLVSSS